MSKILISFLGICTWFEDLRQYAGDRDPNTLPPSRMVLVNGNLNQLCQAPNDCITVAPHVAKIQMFYEQIIEIPASFPPSLAPDSLTFEPNGMTVRVLNPIATSELPGGGNTAQLPSLATQAGVTATQLGPPSRAVLDHDPALGSVHFDVDEGVMLAFQLPQVPMGITQLVIDCDGDPLVEFTPWQPERGGPWTVKLRHTEGHEYAGMNVTNFPPPGDDLNIDFLLQYLSVESFPGFPTFQQITPPQASQLMDLPTSQYTYNIHPPSFEPGVVMFERFDIDPGCSNSNYP